MGTSPTTATRRRARWPRSARACTHALPTSASSAWGAGSPRTARAARAARGATATTPTAYQRARAQGERARSRCTRARGAGADDEGGGGGLVGTVHGNRRSASSRASAERVPRVPPREGAPSAFVVRGLAGTAPTPEKAPPPSAPRVEGKGRRGGVGASTPRARRPRASGMASAEASRDRPRRRPATAAAPPLRSGSVGLYLGAAPGDADAAASASRVGGAERRDVVAAAAGRQAAPRAGVYDRWARLALPVVARAAPRAGRRGARARSTARAGATTADRPRKWIRRRRPGRESRDRQ